MARLKFSSRYSKRQLPLFVEKDEDGFYVVECPIFEGCYSQGKTLDEALRNIKEAANLYLETLPKKEFSALTKNYLISICL